MKSVIKLFNHSLLLLPLLLFMAKNCNVDVIVAAIETSINAQQPQQLLQQQPQSQLPDTLYAPAQPNWYQNQQMQLQQQQLQQQQHLQQTRQLQQQQQQYNPTLATVPLSAPTPAPNLQLPNGVGYPNETVSYSEDTNDEDDDKRPSEIQKAVCTVTAGEVRASAEAVTTKKLKGVCGSAELKLAFSDLEAKLYKELQEIKTLLTYIAQQQGISIPQLPVLPFNYPTMPPIVAQPQITPPPTIPKKQDKATAPTVKSQTNEVAKGEKQKPTTTAATKPLFHPIVENKGNALDATAADDSYEYEESAAATSAETEASVAPRKAPQLKSLKSKHAKPQMQPVPLSSELLQEIKKFNNTLLSDSELKAFTYYWKLENFTERLESGRSSMVESPTFTIKGKPLHLMAYFQHLKRDFLYLQLAQASVKSSNRHNVIIDMGGLFKEIANDKISFKHKITVLNQHTQRSKDLVSQEFNNLETGFLIPNSALLNSPYIKNDTMLIQIFLYL